MDTDSSTNNVRTVGRGKNISFDRDRLLGRGRFGHVWQGWFESKLVAVKRVQLEAEVARRSYKKELDILRTAQHPNVMKCFYHDEDEDFFYIAMELCRCSIYDYVTQHGYEVMDDRTALFRMLFQSTIAIHHLHELNILHRDIKPQNLLLHEFQNKVLVKLSDFGISKMLDLEPGKSSSASYARGTAGYNASEVLRKEGNRKESDVFSLGIVYYELCSKGCHPFGNDSPEKDYNIKREVPPNMSGLTFPEDFEDLVRRMLKHNWRQRCSIENVISDLTKNYCGAGYPGLEWYEEERNDSCFDWLKSPLEGSEFSWGPPRVDMTSAASTSDKETNRDGINWSELGPRTKRMKLVGTGSKADLKAYAVEGCVLRMDERYLNAKSCMSSPVIPLRAAELLVTRNHHDKARNALKRAIDLLRQAREVRGPTLTRLAQISHVNFRAILLLACAAAVHKRDVYPQDVAYHISGCVNRICQKAKVMTKEDYTQRFCVENPTRIVSGFIIPLVFAMIEDLNSSTNIQPVPSAKIRAFAHCAATYLCLDAKEYALALKTAVAGRDMLRNALPQAILEELPTYSGLVNAIREAQWRGTELSIPLAEHNM